SQAPPNELSRLPISPRSGVKTLAQGVSPGSELIAAKSPERATYSAAPSGTPGLPSVAASRRDRRYSEESSVTSRLRPVSFTETVAHIRNRKNTVPGMFIGNLIDQQQQAMPVAPLAPPPPGPQAP